MDYEINDVGGEAYGFFYCDASKQEIKAELPTIRELVKTPPQLELYLSKCMDGIEGDEELTALAQEAKQEGINYILKATCPNETNKYAADAVADIVNQLYNTPLYEDNTEFKGGVVYKENGKYVSID